MFLRKGSRPQPQLTWLITSCKLAEALPSLPQGRLGSALLLGFWVSRNHLWGACLQPPWYPLCCRMDSLQKQDFRRPKIHGAVRGAPYQPPTLSSLQRLLWVRRAATLSHINEVWPNLFLGDA